MKLYLLDPVDENVVARARRDYDVIAWPASREADWRRDADAIMVRTRRVTREDLAQAPRLKIIAKHGVGVDNIDLAAARDRGVVVTNTPSANATSVAEYVVALTLALFRHVARYPQKLKRGEFSAEPVAFEIAGKTVGLVGLGDIGGRVARIFQHGFGARVIACDPWAADETFAALGVTRAAGLEALLAASDIVSLHVPLTAATRHLIDAERLAQMKPESVLINVARGGVVDETALYHALQNGDIFAAACDVFAEEPAPAAHPLLALPNFIGSPHIAGTSAESLIRMGMGALDNIDAVLGGKPALNAL